MNEPAETEFTPLQQQRYDRALEEYWREPVHVKFRDDPRFKDKLLHESVQLATWAARANEMPYDEFNAITAELFKKAQESGDVGGEFYSRVVSNLSELRRLSR